MMTIAAKLVPMALIKIEGLGGATAISEANALGKPAVAVTSKMKLENAGEKWRASEADEFATDKTVGNLEPGNPLSTSLPRTGHRLVINQGNLPTCGPTSCAMVLDTAGKSVDLGALIAESGVTSRGTTLPRLEKTLNNNGFLANRALGATVEDVALATANGDPAVVRMALDRGGHAVVVDGISIRNGRAVVAIRDPALGRQYFTPVAEFRQKFSGEVIYTNRGR